MRDFSAWTLHILLLPVSEQFISAGLEGVLVKTFSELDFGFGFGFNAVGIFALR